MFRLSSLRESGGTSSRRSRCQLYRVVLADDEEVFREWLRSRLEESGDFLVVGEAETGDQVLPLVRRLSPDVVVADIDMPNRDGLDVARDLRSEWPRVKTILMSAYVGRGYARLAKQEGVLFIPKLNLSPEALQKALEAGASP